MKPIATATIHGQKCHVFIEPADEHVCSAWVEYGNEAAWALMVFDGKHARCTGITADEYGDPQTFLDAVDGLLDQVYDDMAADGQVVTDGAAPVFVSIIDKRLRLLAGPAS